MIHNLKQYLNQVSELSPLERNSCSEIQLTVNVEDEQCSCLTNDLNISVIGNKLLGLWVENLGQIYLDFCLMLSLFPTTIYSVLAVQLGIESNILLLKLYTWIPLSFIGENLSTLKILEPQEVASSQPVSLKFFSSQIFGGTKLRGVQQQLLSLCSGVTSGGDQGPICSNGD